MYKCLYTSRYLGTILGSSVISTTVLGDDQPVSMAVHFQLRHRVQVNKISKIWFHIHNHVFFVTLISSSKIVFVQQQSFDTVYNPVCAFWDFNLK